MALPNGFVYLRSVDPSILQQIRYNSTNNFVGRRIDGYINSECILTKQAAEALKSVQTELKRQSLSLLVYDCYRPQRAVDEFVRWSQDPTDEVNKASYYPNVDKNRLFAKGYIAERSGHTRGSTVDLTLVRLDRQGRPLGIVPMGTPYDFLDPLSHPLTTHITGKVKNNRVLLRYVMLKNNFKPLATEWWHFTLKNEPYPNTYFDFEVE